MANSRDLGSVHIARESVQTVNSSNSCPKGAACPPSPGTPGITAFSTGIGPKPPSLPQKGAAEVALRAGEGIQMWLLQR